MANTISDELNRLIQAKAGIKSALESKGLTIGNSSTLDEFPGLIQEMEVGGGGDTSTLIDLIEGDISGDFVIPNGTTKIKDYLFYYNNTLVSITIPSTVNVIGPHAFDNCYNLEEIEFVNFNNSLISTINNSAFKGLNKLERLILPQKIGLIASDAFNSCIKLNNLVIPSTVSQIDSRAFSAIGSQAVNPNVTLLSLTPPSLAALNFANTSCIIYVPGQSVDSYKNAGGNWNNVSTRITPLAAINYDEETLTVTASGRDNLELYIDSSLINSSTYTFTPGAADVSHNITVKSVDPSLGVLDTSTMEVLVEGISQVPSATPTIRFEEEEVEQEVIDEETGEPTGETETVPSGYFRVIGEISNGGTQYVTLNVNDEVISNPTGYGYLDSVETTSDDPDLTLTVIATATEPGKSPTSITKYYMEITPEPEEPEPEEGE